MKAEVSIRGERLHDSAKIRDVVLRAFADVAYSDHREHLMIDRLRETSAYIPELSIIAEMDGELIGHIMLTRAHIVSARRSLVTLALAPLSVVPERQSCGVGALLVGAARQRASDLGFESIVLIGIRSYYARFGFEPLSSYAIALPFKAPEQNCMILPLTPDALQDVSGTVRFAEGWLDH